jgi:DNA-directed RNA polymerase subunit RPC12/RpoP
MDNTGTTTGETEIIQKALRNFRIFNELAASLPNRPRQQTLKINTFDNKQLNKTIMSLTCNGQLQIKCNKCGHQNSINCDDLSFDEVETDQRSGGTETHYQAETEFSCSNCSETIEVTYDVWEYPDGIKNSESIDVKNGTVTQSCNITIQSS